MDDRKKVSDEQFRVILEALEADRGLLRAQDGLTKRQKRHRAAKWESIAKRLNAMENGVVKSVGKWKQTLRDWRCNTKKKVAKLDTNKNLTGNGNPWPELNSLELRLLALYHKEPPPTDTSGIDIGSIAESDPLSSDNNSEGEVLCPNSYTTYSYIKNENSSCAIELEPMGDDQIEVKRRRVQVVPEDVINLQNNILARLTALEASRQESENRQNELLEAVSNAIERHAQATAKLARAAESQAEVMRQMLQAMQERKRHISAEECLGT